jgi:long-subunit fatty acid transport protein
VPLASQFRNFTYVDHYEDEGTGYNFKLGAIFRPVEAVRIGLAFHSPIWYKIDEYYYNDITSNFTDGGHYEAHNDPMRFNYALASPYRLLGGVGIQIKKVALLSVDYEFVDYSSARFSQTGDGYDYSSKNNEIRNTLKAAHNFRFGGEYRIDKIYLRGGYGLYGKAFNPDEDNADLKYNTISGGIGFRDRNFLIDFGYQNLKYSQNYVMYPVDLGVEPAIAGLKTTQNVFTLTFGYKFGI